MPAKKKIKETNAIFAQVKAVHEQAATETQTLRLSLDTKATVKIGPFSRGGHSRTGTTGADHDFNPEGVLTPFGIFQPQTAQSDLDAELLVHAALRRWRVERPDVSVTVAPEQ